MHRSLKLSTIYAAIACMLTGCGGGGESRGIPEIARQLTLNGNWFAERQDATGVVYTGETLLRENGANVLMTHCDGSSAALTRAGNQLFDREGKLYYLYVKDPATLAIRPELNVTGIIRKRSTVGRFDSGSVGVTLPSGETLTADKDVCAETSMGRYRDTLGNELAPSIITISMPYRDSYIRIVAAFRQIADGRYDAVGFEPFIQGGVNGITNSDIESPSFADQYGVQSLRITSGTLQVSNYTAARVTLSADLKTAAGLSVKFTANVKLQPRS